MKKFLTAILLCCAMVLCSCQSAKSTEETRKITLPVSYMVFSTGKAEDSDEYLESVEETVEVIKALGPEYITDVTVLDGSLVLEVTEKQRDKLIEWNNEKMAEWVDPLLKADPLYSFTGSEDYTEATFYYDEKCSALVALKAIGAASGGYAFNNILINDTTDWNVHLRIYNCHTNRIVVDVNIPEEQAVLNDEVWAASYEE